MNPVIHNVKQGSQEWLDLRKGYNSASEANAMMGTCPHKTRLELLTEKKTGVKKEVSSYTQRIFDRGHAVEEMARPIVESIINDDLFNVVMTRNGLLASFDGLTIDNSIIFEHKQWNEELAKNVSNGIVPRSHVYQLEQQLYVANAEKLIFVVSDGTKNKMVYTWYTSDPVKRQDLLNGWEKFNQDLQTFSPVEKKEKLQGENPDDLMQLSITVSGSVLTSNLDQFKQNATTTIQQINSNLQTDQDFADAEQAIKWCKGTETKLSDAKKGVLSQATDIQAVLATLDEISDLTRSKRLELEKLVKQQKEIIKSQLITNAKTELMQYANTQEIQVIATVIQGDFVGAIKGKKTLESMKNAIDLEMVRAKTIIDDYVKSEIKRTNQIKENLTLIDSLTKNFEFLFNDKSQIAINCDLSEIPLIIKDRIAQYKQEQERIAQYKYEQEQIALVNAKKNEQEAQQPEHAILKHDQPEQTLDQKISQVQAIAIPEPEVDLISLIQINQMLGFNLDKFFIHKMGIQEVGNGQYEKQDFPILVDAIQSHLSQIRMTLGG